MGVFSYAPQRETVMLLLSINDKSRNYFLTSKNNIQLTNIDKYWQILPGFKQCKKLERPTGNSLSRALNITGVLASSTTGDFQPLKCVLRLYFTRRRPDPVPEYEAKNSKKELWIIWKHSQKVSGEKKKKHITTKNKSKHVLDTNMSTMPQWYHIKIWYCPKSLKPGLVFHSKN